jgi:hypothetical protein
MSVSTWQVDSHKRQDTPLLPPRIPGGECLQLICLHACDQAVIRRRHAAGNPLVMWVGFALTRASVSGVGSAETKCILPQPTGPATVQSPLTASSPSPPTPTAVGSGPMCVLCRWVWRRPWHCVQLASSRWNAPYTHFRFPLRCSPPAAAQQTGKPVTRALAGMGHVRYASIISSFFPAYLLHFVVTARIICHGSVGALHSFPGFLAPRCVGKRSRGGPGGAHRLQRQAVSIPWRSASVLGLFILGSHGKPQPPGKKPSMGLELDAKVSSDSPRLKSSWAYGGVRGPRILVRRRPPGNSGLCRLDNHRTSQHMPLPLSA